MKEINSNIIRTDNVFKKVNHIELSDGDTVIISNKNCPLSEEDAIKLKVLVPIQEIQSMVPFCKCNGFLSEGDFKVVCPHYFGLFIDDKSFNFDCGLLSPRKDRR